MLAADILSTTAHVFMLHLIVHSTLYIFVLAL